MLDVAPVQGRVRLQLLKLVGSWDCIVLRSFSPFSGRKTANCSPNVCEICTICGPDFRTAWRSSFWDRLIEFSLSGPKMRAGKRSRNRDRGCAQFCDSFQPRFYPWCKAVDADFHRWGVVANTPRPKPSTLERRVVILCVQRMNAHGDKALQGRLRDGLPNCRCPPFSFRVWTARRSLFWGREIRCFLGSILVN